MSPSLHADVYPVAPLPSNPLVPLPDRLPSVWTPSTVTLIHSEYEAVVVDPITTIAQANGLADWIQATIPNKKLKYIFITHGHGDHFFGTPVLLERFPGVIPISTKATWEHAKSQIADPGWGFWNYMYPDGQLAEQDLSKWQHLDNDNDNTTAATTDNNNNSTNEKSLTFTLDNHTLHAIPVGHSDTDSTSILWIPALRLVVAGDSVYNSAFQWLVESPTPQLRQSWIDAVEKIRTLNPTSIVTGHKRAGAVDGVWTLDWTRGYLERWNLVEVEVRKETDGKAGSGKMMFDKMRALYPDNEGLLVLWYSSLAQFGELPGF